MAREEKQRRWKIASHRTRRGPSRTVLGPFTELVEVMPVEDREQRVRELELELETARASAKRDLLDEHELRVGALVQRDAANLRAQAAERLLDEAVEEFQKRGDNALQEFFSEELAGKHDAYHEAADYLKDKRSTLTQQQCSCDYDGVRLCHSLPKERCQQQGGESSAGSAHRDVEARPVNSCTPSSAALTSSDKAIETVVDFLGAWRFCPVSTAESPSRSCLEDAARQLLAAIDRQGATCNHMQHLQVGKGQQHSPKDGGG